MSIDLLHLDMSNEQKEQDFLRKILKTVKQDLGQNAIFTKCLLIRKVESQQLAINTAATSLNAPEVFLDCYKHWVRWVWAMWVREPVDEELKPSFIFL